MIPYKNPPRLFRLAPHPVSLSHHHLLPVWFGLALCLLNTTHTFTIKLNIV